MENKNGQVHLLIIIIVVIIVLCLFFIRVPYDSFPDKVSGMICVNGKLTIREDSFISNIIQSSTADITSLGNSFYCSALAKGDTGVTSQIRCVNEEPIVVCKTQLYKAILMGKIKFVTAENKGTKTHSSDTSLNPNSPQSDLIARCKKECGDNLNPKSIGYTISENGMIRGKYILICECETGDTLKYIDINSPSESDTKPSQTTTPTKNLEPKISTYSIGYGGIEDGDYIYIENNKPSKIEVTIIYNLYSANLGLNETKSQIFNVLANENVSFYIFSQRMYLGNRDRNPSKTASIVNYSYKEI